MLVSMYWKRQKKKYTVYMYSDTLETPFVDTVSLIYSDTDSLLLEFKAVDNIETELGKSTLVEYMDFSNYSKEHPLYDETRTANDYPFPA